MIFNNNMEHFEEDNEIILENYILREKNFIIKSDKKMNLMLNYLLQLIICFV